MGIVSRAWELMEMDLQWMLIPPEKSGEKCLK
jgi:hypothetical protein